MYAHNWQNNFRILIGFPLDMAVAFQLLNIFYTVILSSLFLDYIYLSRLIWCAPLYLLTCSLSSAYCTCFPSVSTRSHLMSFAATYLRYIQRPFIAHFLRPTLTVTLFWSSFDLIGRSFTLAFLSMMMWDVTSTLFEHYFSAVCTQLSGCALWR